MHVMNDWELIQNYCRNGSESAFETLVKRHVDYVYCAALRQVRDPSLAEDVSQAVFLLLAQKSKSFRSGTVLVSWLFRATQHVAGRALRSEHRRQRRELEAAKMNPTITTSESDHEWERVSPILDEALAALPNKDRDAVLLRFISRKPFSQVGAEIGVSEDAAKKRVSRALARLREFFMHRGTTLSASVIAVLLAERAVQASPASLAVKITSAVGAGASATVPTSAAALLKASLRDLFWTKVRWGAAISAGLMAALGLMTTAFRPVHSTAVSAASIAPVAQVQASVDPKPQADDLNPIQNTTNRTLSLSVLRTEDRQPVPGARILADCWTQDMKRVLDAITDTNGVLNIPIPNQTFNVLRIWVSAEGRVPMVMDWNSHEFNEPVTAHALLLEPGLRAEGTILDESGNPVPGARVSFRGPGVDLGKRENAEFHAQLSASFTDANGHWATTQLPVGMGVSIRVTSPDYAPASAVVFALPGIPTNGILVLSNGVALTGQITTADGKPVPNAMVAKQSGTYFSTKTDAEGIFHWPHIEPGQVFIDVDAEGFESTHEFAWATNAVNKCAFTLTTSSNSVLSAALQAPGIRLHGTVVDAETGEPIPSFKILTGNVFLSKIPQGDVVLSNPRLLGEGRDGQFDWPNLHRFDGSRLQVEAEGYLESVSDERPASDSDQEYIFKLYRAAVLTGQVVTPDGSLVEDAVVSLAGGGMGPVMQSPGKLLDPNPGFGATRTRTDHEGKFRLKLKLGAHGVAVVHESGSALVTFADATNNPVVLQSWGAIDGTLYLNGQPAPKQSVMVNGYQKLDADPKVLFSFGYTTSTDEQGRFHFNKVLPGEHTVSREVGYTGGGMGVIVNFDLDVKVKVVSGQVASVELRRAGRPVTGRIVFQGTSDDVHWGASQAFLEGTNKFPFALAKDGSLRADDVPPGTYTLSIELEPATANPQLYSTKPFGSMRKEIVVPSAEDVSVPVDLGELTITRAK